MSGEPRGSGSSSSPWVFVAFWGWRNPSGLWRECYTTRKQHRHLPKIASQGLKQNTRKKFFFLPINSPRTQKSISNVSSKTLKTIILDRSQALDCFNVLVSTNKGGFQNHRLGCLWKVSRIKVLGWPQNCWARVAKAVEEARKENLMMFDVKTKILPQSRHISKLKLINRNNPTGKFNDPL